MSGPAAIAFQPEDMQLLAWKFLDGCASQSEQQQLAGCLTEHEAARAIYLQCVQLHVDLLTHCGGMQMPKFAENPQVLTSPKHASPLGLPVVNPLPPMNVPMPF